MLKKDADKIAKETVRFMQENPYLIINQAVEKARLEWVVAQNKFNMATGDDVDAAALQLTAATSMYDRQIKIAKEEGVRIEQSNFNWSSY